MRTLACIGLLLPLVALGCGDDDGGGGTPDGGGTDGSVVCGAGTVEMNGMCVPGDPPCGAGTVAMDGTCVPDGSVICQNNTIFDMATGQCVPDPDAVCEGDLIYVEATRTCVTPDSQLPGMADVTEPAEPNDFQFNDAFMPPEVDVSGGSASIYGCVEPMDFDGDGITDADFDDYSVTVAGPTLLNVRTDGIGGVTASAAFQGGTDDLIEAGWRRLVLSLSSDGAESQVFLPQAGTYLLTAGDARALLFGEPAGGTGQCYFIQLTLEAMPMPTPVNPGDTVMGNFGNPTFYSLTATDGLLLFPSLRELDGAGEVTDVESVAGASVQVVGTTFDNTFATDTTGVANGLLLDLNAGDNVLLVVDQVFSLAADAVGYEYELVDGAAQALPMDGPVTLTAADGALSWLFFQASAGDVVRLQFDQGDAQELDVNVFNPSGNGGGAICTSCASGDGYVNIVETGFHYVGVFNNDASIMPGDTFDVTFTQSSVTPAALTLGTSAAVDLSTLSRGLFILDLTMADWVGFGASALMNIANVQIDAYPADAFGVLDAFVTTTFDGLASASGGFERIPAGMGGRFLVSYTDEAGTDGDETFSVSVDNVPFTDLGTIGPMTPTSRVGEMLTAGDPTRYLARAMGAGDVVTIEALTAAATIDLGLERFVPPTLENGVSADDAGAGGTETFSFPSPAAMSVFVFTVTDLNAAGGLFDLNVSAVPPPYIETTAMIPFASVCPSQGGAGTVATSGDDELSGAVALGAMVPFFGTNQSEIFISTNGFMTFAAGAGPATGFAETAYNDTRTDVIAPFGGDLVTTEICTVRVGTTFTIEYRGTTFPDFFGDSFPIEFQTVIHDSGRIDFVYGAGHGAPADYPDFNGLVNADRSTVLALFGAPAADTAFTLTPR